MAFRVGYGIPVEEDGKNACGGGGRMHDMREALCSLKLSLSVSNFAEAKGFTYS